MRKLYKGWIITDAPSVNAALSALVLRLMGPPCNPNCTMPLTPTDIARLANLARLELAPDESTRLLTQMNDFFGIVEQMRAVDTTGITPLAHPVDAVQAVALRLREDQVSEPDQRAANQVSAPAVERGLFLVPKVIE